MRLGLVARADNRGLGTLTWEFHRHMRPERTLVIMTGDREFPEDVSRFSGGERTCIGLGPNLSLDEGRAREFLDGLDVVYTAETFYDWRMVQWAREADVKTIVHGMPELTHHHRTKALHDLHPDAWWWPTKWMTTHSRLPKGTIVPIPSNPRSPTATDPHAPGPLRVLHVAGKRALADRDGTDTFIEAMRYATEEIHVTMYSQDREFDDLPKRDGLTWEVFPGVDNRWSLYADQHVMVMPRRYGGLSLKVQESLDCGVPVVLPRLEPNDMWPGQRVPALPGKVVRVPYGPLQTWNTDPHAVAEVVDDLAADRGLLEVDQLQARQWSEANSWTHLKETYKRELRAVL